MSTASSACEMKAIVPILRIFDIPKAIEFYCEYLGFQKDWEHRFEENFPLYMQVSRDGLALHLSEHHGDATPGSAIIVHVNGIRAFHGQLHASNYRFAKPGLEETPWGSLDVTVTDPFGNRIVFSQPAATSEAN
ncbi:putative glyoxalase superfamily protein PhnB [Paenibacillus methanolicus]|uniref:Bleomycin resistance protein n=2 Tax=Paenibacillus methanolicus TaxID=582686 RepID=A0A5S5CIU1_9BACL|nr:putative glyoxalase superfamily protein PhnB [Paenibacillus methanolicus]